MTDPGNATSGLDNELTRTPAATAVISLRGASLFSGAEVVFTDVTISVPARSTTLVMGPSGSGKSALLKVAAGLIPPDTGTVTLLGSRLGTLAKPEERELRRRNGFVFQDAALWQNLTVYQNLALPLQYHGVTESAAEVERRVRALAGEFGMQRRIDLRPAQLSAGERKMVSFLRAIILDPEVLFLDEPTSFVDHHGAELIIGRLRELKKRGTTMVASTHSAKISSQLADYLVVLDSGGGVVAQGTFGDVVHAADRRVKEILSDVLSETASYDTDILDLLNPEG
jgi:phospholipid/cholesterol/gamma-HCH transport system ATP-binding protein